MELINALRNHSADERIDGLFAIERELRALLDQQLAPLGLTYAQYAILRFIDEPKGSVTKRADVVVRTTDVAAYFGFAMRTVTVTVNGLVKAGLVRRRKSATDGRVQELSVTDKGRDVLVHAKKPYQKATRVFGKLAPTHWNALWSTIPSILIEIKKAMPST